VHEVFDTEPVPGSPLLRRAPGVRADCRGSISLSVTARLVEVVQDGSMILEHACLDVIDGEEQRFEEAFAQAQTIIASMPGCRSLRLDRCLETPSRYLLLVEWDRLEDHTEGFRGSAQYQEWRRLLHHFYDPFPVVEHYEPLVQLSST